MKIVYLIKGFKTTLKSSYNSTTIKKKEKNAVKKLAKDLNRHPEMIYKWPTST